MIKLAVCIVGFFFSKALNDPLNYDKNAIVVSPQNLCFDIKFYISHTMLNTVVKYRKMTDLIEDYVVNAQKSFAWHRISLYSEPAIFFKEKDPFVVSRNLSITMQNFQKYIEETGKKADAYVLFIDTQPDETTRLGLARLGGACSYQGVAVLQGGERMDFNPKKIGHVLAHELGHLLGLPHVAEEDEECECAFDQNRCIMNEKTFGWSDEENQPPFHSCSINQVLSSKFHCLLNCSLSDNRYERCGNGIHLPEHMEQCDCGTTDTCIARNANECCDTYWCRLKGNATCSEETCCENCQITSGNVCRSAVNECDIPEYCDGSLADCSEDFYKPNANTCGIDGYCYNGQCGDKNLKCQSMFPNSKNVRFSAQCESQMHNQKGFIDCSNTDLLNSLQKFLCESGGVICGNVWCVADEMSDSFYRLSILLPQETLDCYTLKNDSGLAPNGMSCGNEKMCYSNNCEPVSDHRTACPDCSSNSTCSHKGTCVPYFPQ